MNNPFEPINARLTNLEALTLEVLQHIRGNRAFQAIPDTELYGDFRWLCNICSGVPASTLRIKSAAGEIPGVVKFGKRVLYNKEAVLTWLNSQTRTLSSPATREQEAESQFNTQHQRRGGRKAAA